MRIMLWSGLGLILFLAGCGGNGGNTGGNGSTITSVSVSPPSANLLTQATQQFSSTVNGTGSFSSQVSWSVSGISSGNSTVGTISSNGFYTAPAVPPSPNTVSITAVSTQDSTKFDAASAAISNPVPALSAIAPASIDQGVAHCLSRSLAQASIRPPMGRSQASRAPAHSSMPDICKSRC